MARNLFFNLVGPSGVGKTTLLMRALQDLPNLRRYVTYTSRPPRLGEVDGVDYHFRSYAELARLRDEGQMAEWQEFYDNIYGSPCFSIEEAINGDVDQITSTEALGAETLHRLYPRFVVNIFIAPPTLQVLRERRSKRPGATAAQEKLRDERAIMEMEHAGNCDYALINGDLEEAVRNVEGIIRAERCARFLRQIRRKGLLNLL